MAKPVLLNSLSDTDWEQTWAPANPRRAPVIYFFKKEQQQSVIRGIWKRCVPAQGSLPNLAGNDLIKIPAQPSACAPAELSTDIRIFFLTQDARQRAALVCRLTAFVPSWMRRGEDLHFFRRAAATKPLTASPSPVSRRDRRSPVRTSCLRKPRENKYKSRGCCDLLLVSNAAQGCCNPKERICLIKY